MRKATWEKLIEDLKEDGYVIKKISRTWLHIYVHPSGWTPPHNDDQIYFFIANGKGSSRILGEEEIVLDEYTPKNFQLIEHMYFAELFKKGTKDLIESYIY